MDALPADQPTVTDDPPSRRRSRRVWWLGGGAVLAVVLAVVIVLVVRAPDGPANQDFTHFPSAGCALITKATADAYAPGTTCQVGLDDRSSDTILLDANWLPPQHGSGPISAVLSVDLLVATGALGDSYADKWVSNHCQEWVGVPGLNTRSVKGIGDRACFLYSTKYGTVAAMNVRTRNVAIEVNYGPPGNGSAPAFSEQQGEQAVQTMVAEVIRQLS
ncbi:MAG TPA: hypothetical protein VGN81_37225 [Pseudonocardiaceae bacterium]|jgi:hypothetical protein